MKSILCILLYTVLSDGDPGGSAVGRQTMAYRELISTTKYIIII